MKTVRILIAALALALSQAASAQTAESYITQGRAYLAATNLPAANLSFSNAVYRSPGHQTGNVFYAATKLLVWRSTPVASNFLTRLGFPTAGRNVYNWTSMPPRDVSRVFVAPPGVNANEALAVLRTNLLGVLIGADTNLAKVTSANFTLALTSNETRSAAVTLDYGDIKLLRAMAQAAEYGSYSAFAWDFGALLTVVRSLYTNRQFDAEHLFADYPSLLTFSTPTNLNAAKLAFQNGAARYFEASQFIRSRSTNVVRLFNYDPSQTNQEANFRQTLADLTNSLAHAVTLAVYSNYTVFLGTQFAGSYAPRPFLPVFRGAGFGLGTLPDPTFGGLVYDRVPGVVEDAVEAWMSRFLFPIPTIGPRPSRAAGQFQFPINTLNRRGYAVEVSSDLKSWSNSSAFFSSADSYSFTDPNAHSFSRHFYRVTDRTANMPSPANDNFANRIPLTGLGITASGYNANATIEAGEPGSPPGTVWWSWTAPVSGLVVVGTVGSTASCYVQVYTGTSLASLVLVPTSGAPGVYYNGFPFNALAGTTYQIQVGGGTGGIQLQITAPPSLTVSSPLNNTVFLVPTNVAISASAADSDGSIRSLQFYGDSKLLGNTANSSLSMTWSNVGVGSHFIGIQATDNLGISTSSNVTVIVRPPNDNFANSILISGGTASVAGSNSGASKEPGEPKHAGDAGGASVWWRWTAPKLGTVTISTAGSSFDTLLGVYTGTSVSALTTIASNDDYGGLFTSQVSFTAQQNTTYRIAVDGYGGATGSIVLRVSQP
jgi:hypothetical protein